MSGQDDDSDKSFEATEKKLLDARKKGEFARSTDILTAAGYAGLAVALASVGASSIDKIGTSLMILLGQSADLSEIFFNGGGTAVSRHAMTTVFWGLSPIFLLPAILVISALVVQRAIVFTPSKLELKLSRISIISNAKNKFGRSGLFEFLKSFTKLCVYSLCLAFFLRANLSEMIAVVQVGHVAAIGLLGELFISFLYVAVLVAGVIGGIDVIWQHKEHLRKNRMSRKEIMDETKDAEGDPHMKQERRQRAMMISQSQMMKDVPEADVIIVNPTHFAVALKWSRMPGEAPVCVAKGTDEVAATIREIAQEHQVPIHSDPPTARALHATTELGEEIAPEHFRAVAAAIRFAESMRQRARSGI